MRARSLLGLLGALFIVALERDAGAVERQHHVGAAGGLSILSIDDKSTTSVGGGGTLHYAYVLSDAFNLMVEGGYAVVALGEDKGGSIPATRPQSLAHAGAGVGYVLDVLQWVPYVGLLGKGYVLEGGSLDKTKLSFGGALAAGLDFQATRSWASGAGVRKHFRFTVGSHYPSYSEALLRAELIWGW